MHSKGISICIRLNSKGGCDKEGTSTEFILCPSLLLLSFELEELIQRHYYNLYKVAHNNNSNWWMHSKGISICIRLNSKGECDKGGISTEFILCLFLLLFSFELEELIQRSCDIIITCAKWHIIITRIGEFERDIDMISYSIEFERRVR